MELFDEITNWINSSFCPYKINRAFEIGCLILNTIKIRLLV